MGTGLAVVLVAALAVLAGLVAAVLVVVLRASGRGAAALGTASPAGGRDGLRAGRADPAAATSATSATGDTSPLSADLVGPDPADVSARVAADLAVAEQDRSRAAEELAAAQRDREAAEAAVVQARSHAADLVDAAAADAARTRAGTEDAVAELVAAQRQLAAARARLDEFQTDLEARQRTATEQDSQRAREAQRREERLDGEQARLADELARLAARTTGVDRAATAVADREQAVAAAEAAHAAELERIAGLTAEAARAEVLAAAESDSRRAAAILARDIEADARRSADRTARMVVTAAIQRVAAQQTTESVVSTVALPADEMKGRIIGREGRNIRAFEQVTGVNVIIDDTPDTVVLSCFDPVRREVARVTLEALVADGRIHPHRIDEAYASAQREIAALCRRAAEDALVDVGITDLDPELVDVVGRLRYRTSYGQNVLLHSVEAAHLAGVMAAELGLDAQLLRRCAFLHDIGKALTHEARGSHAIVGAELARRHGEHPDVVHAIEAHHNEVEPRTVEALLTQAADAISAGRPGARRESLEAYVTRLTRLEEIGMSHPGVEKVFAMQAGREVKVMVLPDLVDDVAAQVMAREIVKQVEDELTYPGQIRVTVVRESRATEIAR